MSDSKIVSLEGGAAKSPSSKKGYVKVSVFTNAGLMCIYERHGAPLDKCHSVEEGLGESGGPSVVTVYHGDDDIFTVTGIPVSVEVGVWKPEGKELKNDG